MSTLAPQILQVLIGQPPYFRHFNHYIFIHYILHGKEYTHAQLLLEVVHTQVHSTCRLHVHIHTCMCTPNTILIHNSRNLDQIAAEIIRQYKMFRSVDLHHLWQQLMKIYGSSTMLYFFGLHSTSAMFTYTAVCQMNIGTVGYLVHSVAIASTAFSFSVIYITMCRQLW